MSGIMHTHACNRHVTWIASFLTYLSTGGR